MEEDRARMVQEFEGKRTAEQQQVEKDLEEARAQWAREKAKLDEENERLKASLFGSQHFGYFAFLNLSI